MNGTPVKMWAKMCDATAWQQISNLCSLPFVFHHLALMPDLHGGKGMPIGTVLATRNVVIPNAVGVDIGCGMCAVKTNIQVETIEQDVLRKKIMRGIRHQIPLGMEHHKVAQDEKYMPENHDIDGMTVVKRQYISATKQVGTLGGGNHFIELQKDDEGWLWIMIHSGSRNLGKQVCDYYNRVATILNERYFSSVKSDLNHHVILPRQFFLILSMSQYEILLTSPIANEGPSVFLSTTNLQLKGGTGKEHTTSITAVILRICQKDVLVRQYIPHLPLPIILTNFLSLLQTFLQKSPIISLCKGILG